MNNFEQIMDTLRVLNFENRLRHWNHKSSIATGQWQRNFCTIRINPGRATGKTTYIKSRAQPNDLIIVPVMRGWEEFPNAKSNITPAIMMKHYPTVWIDEPSLCKPLILNLLSYDTLILLGE